MPASFKTTMVFIRALLHRLAVFAFVLAAAGLSIVTIMAMFGAAPWPDIEVTLGDRVYDNAGQIAQIGLTALAVLLCFFLPANARIMALENSHRRFSIGMRDVAQAYAAAHAADRAGLFRMSSEFDSVRERLAYLRDHPDLSGLEPALLEVAAQMSHVSQELADVYSDERVARARAFLRQRQQEVENFNARLDHAKQITRELSHWAHEVELEESVAASQLQRLRDELHDVLPEFGREEIALRDGRIVDISREAAE